MTNNPLPVSVQSAVCYRLSAVHSVCSTINMPRKCVNSSDAFCCICGEVTFKSRRRSFTLLIKKCWEHYFGFKVGDQDKRWAPNFCCVTCARLLVAWAKCSRYMPFAISMVWREPTDHVLDCYFCLTSITGVTAKSICDEAFTSQCAVPCAKASNKHGAEWHWVKWRCWPS
jgi:hypothetical protein